MSKKRKAEESLKTVEDFFSPTIVYGNITMPGYLIGKTITIDKKPISIFIGSTTKDTTSNITLSLSYKTLKGVIKCISDSTTVTSACFTRISIDRESLGEDNRHKVFSDLEYSNLTHLKIGLVKYVKGSIEVFLPHLKVPQLLSLDLSDNILYSSSTTFKEVLKDFLQQHPKLQYLSLKNCKVKENNLDFYKDILPLSNKHLGILFDETQIKIIKQGIETDKFPIWKEIIKLKEKHHPLYEIFPKDVAKIIEDYSEGIFDLLSMYIGDDSDCIPVATEVEFTGIEAS